MDTKNKSNLRRRSNLDAVNNITTSDTIRKTNKYTELKNKKHLSQDLSLDAATNSTKHRIWTRSIVILAIMTIVYFYSKNQTRETKFALKQEILPLRMQKFKCSSSYEAEIKDFPECVPLKCGRFVSDTLVQNKEVELLVSLAKKIFALSGGSSGGASILDIHTGALSYKTEFINVFNVPKLSDEFKEMHLSVYNLIKGKIKLAIAEHFGISANHLYLTYPTFFSRIINATSKTIHDEYWHEHVDKETYPSFHFTTLLYLNNFKNDFKGGRFVFVDGFGNNRTTSTIEPKIGRICAFTSGEENRHHVEKVTEGERYAITISFTCNKKLAIADPKIKTLNENSTN